MKPKHCILASETCEMWVQLTVQSCTFTALGAHQASSAPRVLAVLSLDPTVGLPVALPPEEQGLMSALQQSPVLSGLFFFMEATEAPVHQQSTGPEIPPHHKFGCSWLLFLPHSRSSVTEGCRASLSFLGQPHSWKLTDSEPALTN